MHCGRCAGHLGLEAVTRLHFAQEDEVYRSLE